MPDQPVNSMEFVKICGVIIHMIVNLHGYVHIYSTDGSKDFEYIDENIDMLNEVCREFVADLANTNTQKLMFIGKYYLYLDDGRLHNRKYCYPCTSDDLGKVMEYAVDNIVINSRKFWRIIDRPKYLI